MEQQLIARYLHVCRAYAYDYTRRHWRAWFPALPCYQAFKRRLNLLAPAFEHLITEALTERVDELAGHTDPFIDSLPISLAKWPGIDWLIQRTGIQNASRVFELVMSPGFIEL